jgi:hypothetical protein
MTQEQFSKLWYAARDFQKALTETVDDVQKGLVYCPYEHRQELYAMQSAITDFIVNKLDAMPVDEPESYQQFKSEWVFKPANDFHKETM